MTNEDKYQKIESYLNQEGDEAAQKSFEDQLAQDESLRKEVELHREVQETIKGKELHDFRSALKTIDQNWDAENHQQEKKSHQGGGGKVVGLYRWLAVAAAAIAFFLVYTFLLPTNNQPTDLFAANFQPYPMLLNERSGEAQEETAQLSAAIQAYAANDYAAAIPAFEGLTAVTNSSAYQFYLALSYLGNQQAQQAIPLLETIHQDSNNTFSEQSSWYLALSFLQTNEQEKAKAILATIPPKAYQYEAAQKLLEQL